MLRSQRIRWQRGLAESLSLNRQLLFSRKGGALGWIAFPFAVLFEFASPIVELAGYLFFAVGLALGVVSLESTLAFLALAIGVGVAAVDDRLAARRNGIPRLSADDRSADPVCRRLLESFGYRR